MNRTFFLLVIGCIFLSVFSTGHARSENNQTLSPYFLVESGDGSVDQFPLKCTDVNVRISGVIAEVTVRQEYMNQGAHPIHAKYIFPASTRAAVHGMTMTIGNETITAKIKERKQAEQTFKRARKTGQAASLLEQNRPNVFSMQIANIMPGEVIEIKLSYTELLVPTDGTYAFIYPTVVGPRYNGQADDPVNNEPVQWVNNPYLSEEKATPSRFKISTRICSGIPIQEVFCTSHNTETIWIDNMNQEIFLSQSEGSGGDRDFILKYRLEDDEIESGLMLYEGEEESFFLLMMQPPASVEPMEIPAREYIFVIDISGSMHGFPLNTVKELMRNLIGNLRESDSFNVILFAGSSRLMAESSIPATDENISRAIRLIDEQRGGGGTELVHAIQNALDLPRDDFTSRTIILVTDGYIAVEKTVFSLIHQNLDTNIFAFGIGSSVNRYLIEGVARAGMGEPFIVTKPSEAVDAAHRFQQYIESPVLTDISIEYDGFQAYAVEPCKIPDLLAERPLIVYGKWQGKPEGSITVSGVTGDGKYAKTIYLDEVTSWDENSAIRYLWARTRITEISDYAINPGEAATDVLIDLGIKYNLLTKHTSFVAVHDEIKNPDPNETSTVKQPLPLPCHVSNLAVGSAIASKPEPELYFLIILSSIILATHFKRRKARKLFRTNEKIEL